MVPNRLTVRALRAVVIHASAAATPILLTQASAGSSGGRILRTTGPKPVLLQGVRVDSHIIER